MFDDEKRQRAVEALGILDTPPDARVDRVTRLAQELFGVPMVSVTLIDGDRQWRKSQIGLGGNEAPREHAFCDVTVRGEGTLVVEDASTDATFADNPFVVGEPHLRFEVGLGRTVLAAADLPRDEQESVGADCGRIAVFFVERLAPGREDDVTFGHGMLSFFSSSMDGMKGL